MKYLFLFSVSLVSAFICSCVSSVFKTAEEPPEENPYPVVNVAPYYVADAAWPKRQEDMPWGHMPGVAIDKDGNVWCYTRAQAAFQVYSPTGDLV